jgi:hypothetical protein
MKQCPVCDKHRARDEFARNASRPDGLQYACRNCVSAARKPRQRSEGSARRQHAYRRVWKYGITPCELTVMRVRQMDACAICHEVCDDMQIDHCHETGKVRGLLCGACNRGLGQFKDDVERMRSAVQYLSE